MDITLLAEEFVTLSANSDFKSDATLWAAIIAAIVSAASIVTTIIFNIKQISENKKMHNENKELVQKDLVRQGITQHRINWIQDVRNISTELMDVTNQLVTVIYEPSLLFIEKQDKALELELLSHCVVNRLCMYLNLTQPIDRVIEDYIDSYIDEVNIYASKQFSLVESTLPIHPHEKIPMKNIVNIIENEIKEGKLKTVSSRKLNLAIRIYLKAEWERIKYDTNPKNKLGSFAEKTKIENIIKELTSTFAEDVKNLNALNEFIKDLKNKELDVN